MRWRTGLLCSPGQPGSWRGHWLPCPRALRGTEGIALDEAMARAVCRGSECACPQRMFTRAVFSGILFLNEQFSTS